MVNARRKAVESLYRGICTIMTWETVKNPTTHISTQQEVTALENQPCKLSFEKVPSASPSNGPTSITQGVKLFIAPEIDIPAGSKIIVSQNGKTTEYQRSAEPMVFMDHQEIMLELFKGYA